MVRRTAESTKEALVAAVIRLMSARSVADISVKDIAAEAGVNHGLVHRYFGSKDRLIREAVVRTNLRLHAERPLSGQTVWFHGLLERNPEIARILARCCLDGPMDLLPLAAPPPEALEAYVRPVRQALARLGVGDGLVVYVVNAMGVAALLGWVVFRPLFEAGFAVPAGAEEKARDVARLLDELLELGLNDS